MKFLCGNCKAKYQIADEKVAGRTLRMTCRHCKEQIVIRGTALSVEPASSTPSLVPPEPAGSLYPLTGSLVPEALRMSRAPAPPAPLGARPSQAPPPPPPPPLPRQPPPLHFDAWHVAIGDRPTGPMRRDEVAARIGAGEIGPESLAWREGMDDWLPAEQVPELRLLFGSRVPLPLVPPRAAPPPVLPAASARITPAAPATSDAGPPPREPSILPDRVPGSQNWALMFALAGGFVLAMTSLVIFGVHLLREEPAPAAPVAAAPPAPPAAPVVADLELSEPERAKEPAADEEAAPALDEVEIGAEPAQEARAPRSGSAAPRPKPAKELTSEQREMLARMGGGEESSDLSRLGTSTTSLGGGAKPGTGLSAAELSKVVQRGRESLQRCYEKSLRTAGGSDETVRMDVQITVSPSGNVTSVDVTGNGLPGMSDCLERTVRMWRFPEAGDTTQTKFPLVFQPGG